MRKSQVALAAFLLVLSGCASMEKRWGRVYEGMSKPAALDIMGEPEIVTDLGSKASWKIDDFTQCTLIFKNNDVSEKSCYVDEERRARSQAAAMMFMQSQMRQPSAQQPMQIYQAPRPTRTTCQTRWNGFQYVSDCSSAPSGLDTSIYH